MHRFNKAWMLKQLGNTADDVARTLKENGIRGVRNTARFLNLIVRYAQINSRDDTLNIDVTKGNVLRIIYPDHREEELRLPPAVVTFLDAFNHGAYPELELPTGDIHSVWFQLSRQGFADEPAHLQ